MLLDENGTPFTQGTLTGPVAIVAKPELTFYVLHGEWLSYASAAITVLTLAFLLARTFARRR
jgi:hypothetical protein